MPRFSLRRARFPKLCVMSNVSWLGMEMCSGQRARLRKRRRSSLLLLLLRLRFRLRLIHTPLAMALVHIAGTILLLLLLDHMMLPLRVCLVVLLLLLQLGRMRLLLPRIMARRRLLRLVLMTPLPLHLARMPAALNIYRQPNHFERTSRGI
ncbi:transmembrane protein, putative [Rhizoctonia solani AG-3 Rhs1AP]|uniref:Transmembrane protein, putative n=1 Tax=Rhizoctonia solani AG-3 Rhs1AP TaxID=1086054 RepID=X8IUQ7_9AGAM|nr:transmembrane protein, putative [Rhizoctonia solani AG-3 Rhs1AP]